MFERLENELDITERHLRVLDTVAAYEPVGLITLTNRLDYPKHKVRYSLRVLEAENLVKSTATGVMTTDYLPEFREEVDRRLMNIVQRVEELQIEKQPSSKAVSEGATAD